MKEEILDAARYLFAKEGYENVSIRKIADRIEYSPGTIYLYFKDKADIFDTICEETFARMAKRLAAIVDDNADVIEKLRRIGRTYIQFAVENPNEYALVFAGKKERMKEGQNLERLQTNGLACFENLRRLVQQAVEAGRLRLDDVDEVSQVLWSAVHGVAMLLIACQGFPFIEHGRLIERAVDVAVEGVRLQP